MTFKQANKMSTLQQNTNVNDNMKVDIKKRITIKQKNNAVYNSNRESLCHLLAFGIILGIITANAIVAAALRNVNLIIEPPAVRRGQHAILRCLYDLEGTPLYSAKFYRGQLEFYRYTPGEFPNTKVFPFPGIYVDVTSSNATQVLIRNVGFGLSGNFSCEVTADRPLFSTATAVGTMQVVELPEKRPQLFTEHTRYEPGDILRANCSTPPSRPRAELQFTINNMVVNNVDTQHIRTIDNLIASRISLKLQLQGIHFSSTNPSILYHNANMGAGYYNGGQMLNSVHGLGGMGGAGGLLLRCTATIGDLYQEYKEIELGTPQKDPIPARVTLSSSSSMRNFFSYFSSSAASRTKLSCFPIAFYLLLSGSLTTMLLSLPTLKLHLKDLKFSMQQTELILPQKYLLNNNSNNKINNNKNTNKDENIHSTHAQRLLCER